MSDAPTRFFTAEAHRRIRQRLFRILLQGTSQDAVEQAKDAALRRAERHPLEIDTVTGAGEVLDHALQAVIPYSDVFAGRLELDGTLLFWDRDDAVSEVVVMDLPGFRGAKSPEFLMKRRGAVSTRLAPTKNQSVTVIASTGKEADAWSGRLAGLDPESGLAQIQSQPDLQVLYVALNKEDPALVPSKGWPAMSQVRFGIGTRHQPQSVYNTSL